MEINLQKLKDFSNFKDNNYFLNNSKQYVKKDFSRTETIKDSFSPLQTDNQDEQINHQRTNNTVNKSRLLANKEYSTSFRNLDYLVAKEKKFKIDGNVYEKLNKNNFNVCPNEIQKNSKNNFLKNNKNEDLVDKFLESEELNCFLSSKFFENEIKVNVKNAEKLKMNTSSEKNLKELKSLKINEFFNFDNKQLLLEKLNNFQKAEINDIKPMQNIVIQSNRDIIINNNQNNFFIQKNFQENISQINKLEKYENESLTDKNQKEVIQDYLKVTDDVNNLNKFIYIKKQQSSLNKSLVENYFNKKNDNLISYKEKMESSQDEHKNYDDYQISITEKGETKFLSKNKELNKGSNF